MIILYFIDLWVFTKCNSRALAALLRLPCFLSSDSFVWIIKSNLCQLILKVLEQIIFLFLRRLCPDISFFQVGTEYPNTDVLGECAILIHFIYLLSVYVSTVCIYVPKYVFTTLSSVVWVPRRLKGQQSQMLQFISTLRCIFEDVNVNCDPESVLNDDCR